jgi:hypothetical protein
MVVGREAGDADRMTPEPSSYHRHRFPGEIIRHAVWLYPVFSLSLRGVELILAVGYRRARTKAFRTRGQETPVQQVG